MYCSRHHSGAAALFAQTLISCLSSIHLSVCDAVHAYILMILQCSYHGWQFEGDGQCALIPQASDAAAANAAQSSRRLAHTSQQKHRPICS
jgi:Rieske [2Fe-2S] domain